LFNISIYENTDWSIFGDDDGNGIGLLSDLLSMKVSGSGAGDRIDLRRFLDRQGSAEGDCMALSR